VEALVLETHDARHQHGESHCEQALSLKPTQKIPIVADIRNNLAHFHVKLSRREISHRAE